MDKVAKKFFIHVTQRSAHSNKTFHGLKPIPNQGLDDEVHIVKDKSLLLAMETKIPVGEVVMLTEAELVRVGDNRILEGIVTPLRRKEWEANAIFSRNFRDLNYEGIGEVKEEKIRKVKVTTLMSEIRTLYTCPTIEDNGFYVDPDLWAYLVRNAKQRKSTLLKGPTGSGKTEIMQFISKAIGKPLVMHDMGGMQDGIVGLIGQLKLSAAGTKFDFSPFVRQIQEPNMIVLYELNRAPANTGNILFPVLDSRKTLPTTLAGSELTEEIAVNPECVIFATANIGGEYTGTNELDRALSGRFLISEVPYMPEEMEALVLDRRTKCTRKHAEAIAKIANLIRDQAFEGHLSETVGHRETLEVGYLIQDGMPAATAMQLVFLPLFPGNDVKGERSQVKSIILSR